MPCHILLVLALAVAACVGDVRSGCGSRALPVVSRSTVEVEQVYLGSGAPDGWGANLLTPAGLRNGASTTVRTPAGAASAMRVVWTNGQAVESGTIDACRIRQVSILDAAILAE